MIIKKTAFITSAANGQDRIVSDLPQIAVVGKSNVGKSSFINYLANDSKLARTSKAPGRTRLINYFLFNEDFILTDLPGYGFAKVSWDEKKKWSIIIEDYLNEEPNLKLVCFLVDICSINTCYTVAVTAYRRNYNICIFASTNAADRTRAIPIESKF